MPIWNESNPSGGLNAIINGLFNTKTVLKWRTIYLEWIFNNLRIISVLEIRHPNSTVLIIKYKRAIVFFNIYPTPGHIKKKNTVFTIILDFVLQKLCCHGRRIKNIYFTVYWLGPQLKYLDRWFVTSTCTSIMSSRNLKHRPGHIQCKSLLSGNTFRKFWFKIICCVVFERKTEKQRVLTNWFIL